MSVLYWLKAYTAQIVAGSQPISVIWRIRQMMPAKGRPMVKNVSHGRIKAISKRMFSLSIGLMKIYPLIGHESICWSDRSPSLYESDRVIGETEKPTNAMSVRYLQARYKRDVPTSVRSLQVAMRDGAVTECYVQEHTEYGFEKTMRGKVTRID